MIRGRHGGPGRQEAVVANRQERRTRCDWRLRVAVVFAHARPGAVRNNGGLDLRIFGGFKALLAASPFMLNRSIEGEASPPASDGR